MHYFLFIVVIIKVSLCDLLKLLTKNLNYYEIDKGVFITASFHKKKDNYVLLHGITKHKKPKLYGCKIVDYKVNYTCFAKYSKYKKMDKHFFDVKIEYENQLNPKFVYLNKMLIKVSPSLQKYYKYVVCSPVMYNYTQTTYLIQRMESLKYLGVSKVVTYFIDASVEIQKILKYYIKTKFLDLYRFDKYVEYNVWKNRYYGEVWKLNHCFHKYQENAQYIFNSDFDEIIWPTKSNSYDEMFNLLPKSDIFYFTNRIFIIPQYYYSFKDYDLFNISDTCVGKTSFSIKYVIANPFRYSNIEVHVAVYHDWFLKETIVDSKYGFIRHTKFLSKYIKDRCIKYIPYEEYNNVNNDRTISIRVNRIKEYIFVENKYN